MEILSQQTNSEKTYHNYVFVILFVITIMSWNLWLLKKLYHTYFLCSNFGKCAKYAKQTGLSSPRKFCPIENGYERIGNLENCSIISKQQLYDDTRVKTRN